MTQITGNTPTPATSWKTAMKTDPTQHPGRHYPPPNFGPTLTAGRQRARLGLREAARAAGISAGYWCLLEQGERSPSESVAELLIHTLHLPWPEARIVRAAAVPGAGRDYDPFRVTGRGTP